MKLDHQKLQTAYIAKINKICEDCEDKSHFSIPEIVSIIAELIDTGKFYLPPSKTSVLELCDTWRKLSPEWSAETNAFVDELYSRLEWAETEVSVLHARLNKNWTAGSNLYVEKDLIEAYNKGYKDGQNNFYGENRPKEENQVPACPKCGEKMIFINAVDFNGWSCVHTAGCVFHLRAFNVGYDAGY